MALVCRSRTVHTLCAAVGAAVLTLALAACGSSSGEASGPQTGATAPGSAGSSPSGTPQHGGTLTVMAGGPVQSWDPKLNPNTIPGVTADRLNAIFGVLIYTDAQGKIQPGMAKSLTSSDNKTWTLTLKPGIKFTDGTPYDAAAVKYNWDRIAAPDSGAPAQQLAASFTTEVKDATTLIIHLKTEDPAFPYLVAESLQFVASPKSLKAEGDNYTKPVGAGAFMLKGWNEGVQETLVRNPDYYEKDRPYLDKIVFKYVQDPAQRVATVVQGGGQYMNGYTFQFSTELDKPGFSAYKVPAGGLRMFYFNTARAPFNDVRARRAVALAMDPTSLVQTLTKDPSATSWDSLFAKSSPYYDKSLTLPKANTDKAQDLVDELKADGKTMKFSIVAAAVPELQRAAQALQAELSKLDGVDASVKTVALADWHDRTFTQHNFDITFYPGIYDLNGAEVSMTNLLGSGGPSNAMQYKSAAMDQALAAARGAEPDQKVAAFAKVQRVYLKDIPLLMFGLDYRAFFHSDSVGGFTPMGSGSLLMKELYRTK